jgi:hypothetical protein
VDFVVAEDGVDDLTRHPRAWLLGIVVQFEFQQSFEFRHVPPESAATPDLMSEISPTIPDMV